MSAFAYGERLSTPGGMASSGEIRIFRGKIAEKKVRRLLGYWTPGGPACVRFEAPTDYWTPSKIYEPELSFKPELPARLARLRWVFVENLLDDLVDFLDVLVRLVADSIGSRASKKEAASRLRSRGR